MSLVEPDRYWEVLRQALLDGCAMRRASVVFADHSSGGNNLQAAVRLTTWVQPGGKIEVSDTQLPAGEPVDVIVLFPQPGDNTRRSIVEILAEAPGHLAFETADDVDAYLREERDAWER